MTFLQMIRVWWRLRRLKPVGLSIDITDRCLLSCAGCYMKWYERNDDLPLERWDEIIRSFPECERMFCAWTGGEPLLRADDIRVLSRHFRWSWIATNGTLPVPDIPRTTVFVSVDGPKVIHESLRGGFSEIVRNVRPECYIACTVRRQNCTPGALRELVEFWRGRARGIVFGFLTPRRERQAAQQQATEGTERIDSAISRRVVRRSASVLSVTSVANETEQQSLGREERQRVVETLRELKREFGGFILGVPGQIADCARTAWGRRCPAEAVLVTFDAAGRRKRPCTLGAHADCASCGCAVPGFLRRVRLLHPPTVFGVSGLFR